MDFLGQHYILELYHCDKDLCNDAEALKVIMLKAVEIAKATVVQTYFHQFSPYGISGTIVIAESHFNIHTWPEHQFMAIDLFTCGDTLDPDAARDYLIKATGSKKHEYKILDRGDVSKV